jgi:hypothetical protein
MLLSLPPTPIATEIIALLFDPLPIRDLARLLAKPMGDIRLHLQELRSVLLVPYHADHPICGYWTDFGLNWPITEVFPPFFVSANEREKSEPSLREAL